MKVKFNAKVTQDSFERDYRKAYIKLLSGAAKAPKLVDEFFFGKESDRDEESAEIRPYTYAFISFCLAMGIFILAQK